MLQNGWTLESGFLQNDHRFWWYLELEASLFIVEISTGFVNLNQVLGFAPFLTIFRNSAQVWHNLHTGGIAIWEGPIPNLIFEQFLKTNVSPLHAQFAGVFAVACLYVHQLFQISTPIFPDSLEVLNIHHVIGNLKMSLFESPFGSKIINSIDWFQGKISLSHLYLAVKAIVSSSSKGKTWFSVDWLVSMAMNFTPSHHPNVRFGFPLTKTIQLLGYWRALETSKWSKTPPWSPVPRLPRLPRLPRYHVRGSKASVSRRREDRSSLSAWNERPGVKALLIDW